MKKKIIIFLILLSYDVFSQNQKTSIGTNIVNFVSISKNISSKDSLKYSISSKNVVSIVLINLEEEKLKQSIIFLNNIIDIKKNTKISKIIINCN